MRAPQSPGRGARRAPQEGSARPEHGGAEARDAGGNQPAAARVPSCMIRPLVRVAPGAALLACAACDWVSLAVNAATYRTLAPGEAGNVVAANGVVYATLGDSGFAVLDGASGARVAVIPPAPGSQSVDDVAVDGTLLFALDATPPGRLSLWSIADPRVPTRMGRVHDVAVGPFSGVSAAGKLCVVSGGTSELTAFRYSRDSLEGPVATMDLGRGQPDVLVARDGRTVYVSTHYWGPYFGLDVVQLAGPAGELRRVATLAVDGAGFTRGGAKPANFPIEAALVDDTTVALAYARGLALIAVADPARPRVLRVLDVGGPAVNVDALDGQLAVVVSGAHPAVALVDGPSASGLPRAVALPPGTKPRGVAFSGSSVFLAARDKGVLRVAR